MSVEDFLDDIDYDKIIPKESEFMDHFEAFGNGRLEPQKALIYFNKKRLEIEEDLTRNPDYGLLQKLQRQKAEIEDYLKKIYKILNPEGYPKSERVPDIPGIDILFFFYPEFIEDLPLLIENKFILVEDRKLVWDKSKKSLAEYFGNQTKDGKNNKWEFIEHLFGKKDLKNSFSTNGSSYDRKKPSKDYNEWLKIKSTPKGV